MHGCVLFRTCMINGCGIHCSSYCMRCGYQIHLMNDENGCMGFAQSLLKLNRIYIRVVRKVAQDVVPIELYCMQRKERRRNEEKYEFYHVHPRVLYVNDSFIVNIDRHSRCKIAHTCSSNTMVN